MISLWSRSTESEVQPEKNMKLPASATTTDARVRKTEKEWGSLLGLQFIPAAYSERYFPGIR